MGEGSAVEERVVAWKFKSGHGVERWEYDTKSVESLKGSGSVKVWEAVNYNHGVVRGRGILRRKFKERQAVISYQTQAISIFLVCNSLS